MWLGMAQRRKPAVSSLRDANHPADAAEDVAAANGADVSNDLRDMYFIDYRPFGVPFTGQFFTNSLNNTSGTHTLIYTSINKSSAWGLYRSYGRGGTQPVTIATSFSYQMTDITGLASADANNPSAELRVSGNPSNTTQMYGALRLTADNDPNPYPLTAYVAMSGESTVDTLYRYYRVSSFPTTFGYTFGSHTSEDDRFALEMSLNGPKLYTGANDVLPWAVETFGKTFYLETPNGGAVTFANTDTFDTFTVSTYSTEFRAYYFQTGNTTSRLARDATPISEAGSPFVSTST